MKKLVREILNPIKFRSIRTDELFEKIFNEIVEILPGEIQDVLEKLKHIEQPIEWHPEGSVFEHEKIVTQKAIQIGDINLIIASIFHDLGKLTTTKLNNKGKWSSPGHDVESTKYVVKYEDWIRNQGADFDEVKFIVENHMRMQHFSEMRKEKQIKLMSSPYFEKLELFSKLDDMLN